jgi:hypothetical protein
LARPTMLFLIGVTPRCGSNYLFDLLRQHPDIDTRPPIMEDFILHRSQPLIDFATGITTEWEERWQLEPAESGRFLRLLGEAIESFLVRNSTAHYILVKTPSPVNVQLAPLLFPRSPVVLLIRDGRAVAESTRLSWGTPIDETARQWAENGRLMLNFLRNDGGSTLPRLLVRYEDLVTDTEAQLRRLLKGLDLDAERYDFDRAAALPVRGSSVLRGGADQVHWDPISRTPDFDPIRRHHGWGCEETERFAAVAGDVLAEFGYQPPVPLEDTIRGCGPHIC